MILVLGPTGHVGPHVIDELCAMGVPVRAMVRDLKAAATVLPEAVELVQGAFADSQAMDRAMDGVEAVFLLSPHGPEMVDVQLSVIRAAQSARARIVKLSGTSSAVGPRGPQAGQQHWRVEQALASSGSPYAILRPNAFMQGLLAGLAASAGETGVIVNPLGDAGLSLIDCADIGRCAARVLTTDAHDGTTFILTGPLAPTYRELGERIGDLLGAPVEVRDVSPEMVATVMRERGASAWEAGHLRQMLNLFRAHGSEYVTDDVERLTGRPATTADDFLRRHVHQLTAA